MGGRLDLGTFAQALAVIRMTSFDIDIAESELEAALLRFHNAAVLAWNRDKKLMTANFSSMWQLAQSREWLGAASFAGSTMIGERSHLEAKQVCNFSALHYIGRIRHVMLTLSWNQL